MYKKIWITWERQRRSIELSKELKCDYFELAQSSSEISFLPLRYLYLSAKTLNILLTRRPNVIFAQNPSIILASFLCFLRTLFKYKLIIDRHSNFKLNNLRNKKLKWRLFHFFSKYSVKNCEFTIVTNAHLKNLIDLWGGKGHVLQDKLPQIREPKLIFLPYKKNIAFISSFSEDEPLMEVIEAANLINPNWGIYITGSKQSYMKKNKDLFQNLPSNINLTGFIPETDYYDLIYSADLLIVMTTQEYTLTCGAYEGISLGKAIILSDTKTIKEYFCSGVLYSKPDAQSIAQKIIEGIKKSKELQAQVAILKEQLEIDWMKRFKSLNERISHL